MRAFCAALALLLPLSGAAQTSLRDVLPEAQPSLLPAAAAFAARAWMTDEKTLQVEFTIAPGYYLYRDQLAFAPDSAVLAFGAPRLPPGEKIRDEFFGETVIYRGLLALEIPLFKSAELNAPFVLRAVSQGCSERPAVCYPPFVQHLQVAYPLAGAAPAAIETPAAAPPVGKTAALAARLGQGRSSLLLLTFLGLGILLAFTPCVLPLLPVLAGIIAGPGGIGTRRAFGLALVYVLAMATAYAVAGAAAGLSGIALQGSIQQSPWVLSFTALVLVLLALSMFGFYSLQLPAALSSRADGLVRRRGGSSPAGAALMGVLSALVISPCVSPPLIAALGYIASTGDAWLGGAALFALGLGLGLPLLVFAFTAGRLLPKAGPWIQHIRTFFGILLLGVALWLTGRLLPPPSSFVLLGLLLLSQGLWLWHISAPAGGWRPLIRGLALVSGLWGALVLGGAAIGGGTLFEPLRGLAGEAGHGAPAFTEVKSFDALEQVLTAADGRPAMLDVYADWCISCREMEARTFPDAGVQAALGDALLLRADVTRNNADDRALLRHFGLFGAPAVLFFDRRGRELESARVIGYRSAPDFAATVTAAFN